MAGLLRACIGLLSALVFAASTAAAEAGRTDVDNAQALYDTLRFEAAEQAIAQALFRPGRDAGEVAALYRLRGLIAAARDDGQRAQGDFVRWLSLDSKGQLPGGVAPKVMTPFRAALRELRGQPGLSMRPVVLSGRGPSLLRIDVVGDPGRLGQAVLLRYALGDKDGVLRSDISALPGGSGRAELSLEGLQASPEERRGQVRYFVELLGEHGSRLLQVGSLARPLTLTVAKVKPLYKKWWLWTAVAAASAAAIGVGIGVSVRSR